MPELYLHYRCFLKTNKECFSELDIFPSIANFENLENPDNFTNLDNLGNPKNHLFFASARFSCGGISRWSFSCL